MPKITTMRHCNAPQYLTRVAISSGEEELKTKLLPGEQKIYGG
jgi:hypothetical protein